MKRLLILSITFLAITSFRIAKPTVEKVDNIVLFYVENSRGANNVALSSEAIEKLETELKKNYKTPSNRFLIYWSNDTKYDYTKKAENSNRLVNSLFERNSRTPNVLLDKDQVRNLIFDNEFTIKGNITLHFFVTETFLIDYAVQDEPSLLLGLLPREMAFTAGVDESKVTVNIYYNNSQNKLSEEVLKGVNNFNNQSKVTYNYILLK